MHANEIAEEDWRQFLVEKTLTQAWLDERGSFNNVEPQDIFHYKDENDKNLEFTLQEYVDEDGQVLACMMFVPDGSHSWAWHIYADAGDGLYLEQHMVAAGKGRMLIWDEGEEQPRAIQLGVDNDTPVVIRPGQTFQIIADPETDHPGENSLLRGLLVCAFFRRVPFKLQFEKRDETLTAVGASGNAKNTGN